MELLRRVASFGIGVEDLKNIYFLFVRSQLEQSAVVWHSSLTEENRADLERVQRSAVKIIMGEGYNGYQKALNELSIESLDERRKTLCLKFSGKCCKGEKTKKMFPINEKQHGMITRIEEIYKVKHANTGRLQNDIYAKDAK